MKTRTLVRAGLVCALLVGACDTLTSPNENFGDLDELRTDPDRASLFAAVQGLMVGNRVYYGQSANDLVGQIGIIGRESYNHDINDPRFETELLAGDLQGGSPAFGGNFWSEPYANIRLGDIVLTAVGQLDDVEITEAEREWVRGFTKTINAIDFLWVVNTRDTNCGCPIQVPEDVARPAPQVNRDDVFAHVVTLLEEAAGHLANTSGPAPFRLSSGFSGFDTAETFLQFNRAMRARVAAYMEDWDTVLTALDASFVDPEGDLDLGVYHAFGTGAGDVTNGYFDPGPDPNLRAHPSLGVDVETKTNGDPDDRFTRKTRTIASRSFNAVLCTPQSQFPVCDIGFDIYTSLSAPVPVIRNEELLLLRAEANIGLGNLGDAETDLNLVRDRSGGLEPVALTSQEQAVDRLLYERRYSLLFEGGHRWLDARRYDRLDELPLDVPGHQVNPRFPLPSEEVLGRR